MANDKDIKIGIKTTGAQEAAREFDRVGDAAETLGKTASRVGADGLQAMSDKARVNEFAFYDLDAEIAKTTQSSATFTAGQTQVQRSTRNSAQALLMFSQGFEDASYGIRGVLNNIPGLVIALGGTAGLAGAISIAAVGLSQIIPLFTETEEKASDVADRIQEISDNMAEMETERFEAVGDAIEAARDRTAALKQEFDDTAAAEQAFSTAALDNTAKLAEAQTNVAAALGQQVDSYKTLQAIAEQEAAQRKLAAEQAIAAEQQKLVAQQSTVTEAADFLQQQRQRADIEQANLATLRGQLEVMRAQRDELEKFASGGGYLNEIQNPELRAFADAQAASARGPRDLLGKVRGEAGRMASDPTFNAGLDGLQAKVAAMEKAVESLTKDGGIVAKAENAFLAAQNQLADLSSAVATNISRIEQTFTADDLLERSQTVAAAQEQQAKQLSAALGNIQTTTEAGRAAAASIQAVVADGRVTANESEQLAQASVQIIGQIQAGLATAGANTQEILGVLRAVASREMNTKRELAELRRMVEELQR